MSPNCQPVQFTLLLPSGATSSMLAFPGAFRTSQGCMLASGTIHKIQVVAGAAVTVDVYDALHPTTNLPSQSTNRRRFEIDVTNIDAERGGGGGAKDFECVGSAITGGVALTDLTKVGKLYFPANSGPQDNVQLVCPFGMILVATRASSNFAAGETMSVQYVPKCIGRYRVRLAERQQELASS